MRLFTTIIEGQNAQKEINAGVRLRGTDGFELAASPDTHLELETGELGCESVRVGRLTSTGHRYRFENGFEDWFGIAFIQSGEIGAATENGTLRAAAGETLLLAPGRRDVRSWPSPGALFRSRRLLISRQTLLTQLAREEVYAPVVVRSFSAATMAETTALADEVARLVDSPSHLSRQGAGRAEKRLTELVCELLLATGALRPQRKAPASSIEDLRRAEAYIRAHAGDNLSMTEVAEQLNISTRSLQATFRKYRNLSPHAYLDAVRLGRVHQQLLTILPDETIADIALEAGFNHLGRFSARYKARYGEAPSQTVASARVRSQIVK